MFLDQNEVPQETEESVRIIFFVREMEDCAVIRALLDEESGKYLKQNRAVYVACISSMPRVTANPVTIPR